MAATLLIPSMAILILILLLNPASCKAAVNETASGWCDGTKSCLVGDENSDWEFMMETDTSRMLLDFQHLQTLNTNDPNKQSVPDCERPPRYDSCLGQKNQIPHPENCNTVHRTNPC